MRSVGTITRAGGALRINLMAWGGGDLVVGMTDAALLLSEGRGVPVYEIRRGDDVDVIDEAGSVAPTRSGRGVQVLLTRHLAPMYSSLAQVRAVAAGERLSARLGVPDTPVRSVTPDRSDSMDEGLQRGFGDAANPPRRAGGCR
ncbi:hypothetical protein [Methanofollis fontis]|uniref:Uncharacterized protein n=1 Tax=Methanofollis fontis TaxID=2052832 RepID=A0A483CRI4_9EURY|nr:hypothetical protein [Methanofollis fontis]TAJ43639.1 hypothetical protein CUJ86_09850 [Methanofollis fontis]